MRTDFDASGHDYRDVCIHGFCSCGIQVLYMVVFFKPSYKRSESDINGEGKREEDMDYLFVHS
jgi:hypothetical protein